MKQRIVIPILLLICLTLGACGNAGPKEPDWDANTLVYAHTIPWEDVSEELLDEFREAHPDIQLEVRDYSDEGGRDRLLTEMLAGNIPDIIEIRDLPYQQMVEKGYLEDLWPFIENDPDIGRENVMETPLKAAETDGKLCTVFRSVMIRTLVGPESLVGDRYSWTVEDLLNAFSRMPEGSTITDYYATKEMMFGLTCTMSLESYVDWDTGECSFDDESFHNMLEFVNCFPDEFNENIDPDELRRRRTNGLEMLSSLSLMGLSEIQYYECERYGERISFVGYPAGDGSVGSCFIPSTRYAMSSTCRQKEAAWDLLRTVLLPEYGFQSMKSALELLEDVNFPVNRADYDTMVRVYMAQNGYRRHYTNSEEEMPALTEDQLARFEDFYSRIDKVNICDMELYSIVWEQCGAYFSGDKTLDETIDLIQRHVSLYVNEVR